MKNIEKEFNYDIENKIFSIRKTAVMLDSDLALLYEVEAKRLNEQVKRNADRFPASFMFQLSEEEWSSLRSQIATLKKKRGDHKKYLPYVFTEQGVAMLSAILKSKTAIQISIKIINAFVEMRKLLNQSDNILVRINNIEWKQLDSDRKFEQIFTALEQSNKYPTQGIFFEGKIFDAYVFFADIIKKAEKSVILIDNYIDEYTLALLSKRPTSAKAIIYTKNQNSMLTADLQKHNQQYAPIIIRLLKNNHDRFLIVDEKEMYHIGASLKDLGKKLFAFSKMNEELKNILSLLE